MLGSVIIVEPVLRLMPPLPNGHPRLRMRPLRLLLSEDQATVDQPCVSKLPTNLQLVLRIVRPLVNHPHG